MEPNTSPKKKTQEPSTQAGGQARSISALRRFRAFLERNRIFVDAFGLVIVGLIGLVLTYRTVQVMQNQTELMQRQNELNAQIVELTMKDRKANFIAYPEWRDDGLYMIYKNIGRPFKRIEVEYEIYQEVAIAERWGDTLKTFYTLPFEDDTREVILPRKGGQEVAVPTHHRFWEGRAWLLDWVRLRMNKLLCAYEYVQDSSRVNLQALRRAEKVLLRNPLDKISSRYDLDFSEFELLVKLHYIDADDVRSCSYFYRTIPIDEEKYRAQLKIMLGARLDSTFKLSYSEYPNDNKEEGLALFARDLIRTVELDSIRRATGTARYESIEP